MKQLKAAIHSTWPDRRERYQRNRSAFKDTTLQLCGPIGHGQLPRLLWHLDSVLLWDHANITLLVRRGIVRYRLRELEGAQEDLTAAITASQERRGTVDPDALRYRALVRELCNDFEGARADVDDVLRREEDPLALALSSSIAASCADLESAQADLERAKHAISRLSADETTIAAENRDLVRLALGWAHASVSFVKFTFLSPI